MTEHKLVVGNWKMNLGISKARELAEKVVKLSSDLKQTEAWIAPVFTSLATVAEVTKGSSVKYGAQNVHWADSGAFTGEISPSMLQELGCSFAIVGHSERRHIFLETDELISKRAEGALKAGIGLIYCIGETLPVRENGQTNELLASQLEPLVKVVEETGVKDLVLAYEPVWAIGTGKVATIGEIEQAHSFIQEHWKNKTNLDCPLILYGGSVSPDNYAEIVALEQVGGALVGGASLVAEKFSTLLTISEQR